MNLQAEPDHVCPHHHSILDHRPRSKDPRLDPADIDRSQRNTLIEYLPDPQIMFPGARLASQVILSRPRAPPWLSATAFSLYDPNGAGGLFDRLASELVVETPEGRLRCLDRFEITGEQLGSDRRFTAHGTFVCVDEDLAEEARVKITQSLSEIPGLYAGVSTLPTMPGVGAAPRSRHTSAASWIERRLDSASSDQNRVGTAPAA